MLIPRLLISSQQTEFCELKSPLASSSKFIQPFKKEPKQMLSLSTCILCKPPQKSYPICASLRRQHYCHSELWHGGSLQYCQATPLRYGKPSLMPLFSRSSFVPPHLEGAPCPISLRTVTCYGSPFSCNLLQVPPSKACCILLLPMVMTFSLIRSQILQNPYTTQLWIILQS